MRTLITAILFSVSPLLAVASAEDDAYVRKACMQSLARFAQYAKNIYTDAGVNARGDSTGFFRAQSAGRSNEDGVRTNLDLAMVCAFLYERLSGSTGPDGVALPEGVSVDDLRGMSLRALRYAYGTHNAIRLQKCTDGRYWGTFQDTAGRWHHQWESSLWTLSLAFAAHALAPHLRTGEQADLHRLIASEADFQLSRPVPTGFRGDTKAEENGWEANVLAVAWTVIPQHPHAGQWQEAMNRYGFNCYTVDADAADTTVVGDRRAKDWYAGTNLYPDFTLQNHDYFHTSYQNVVMQEQAETILAISHLSPLTSSSSPLPPHLSPLTWHWQEVWTQVLAQLALADGELAMPNGNDWSMFLYDQLPAYAAMACIMQNPDALMLERRCLDQLLRRQATTPDGSYMLNADIGPRRMGVTAHRVMMTCLLHEQFPTRQVSASSWRDFAERHAGTRLFPCQQVVRALSKECFACFSWSRGLGNATGIIVSNSVADSKIVIPYKEKGTGNFLGNYNGGVARLDTCRILTEGRSFTVEGRLLVADGRIPQVFTFAADAANQVRVDYRLEGTDTIFSERGGTVAVSVDPFTQERRTLYFEGGQMETDGTGLRRFRSSWVNIDNRIGIIALAPHNEMAFGDRRLINSIHTAFLYPTYGNQPQVARDVRRTFLYYTGITARQTRKLARKLTSPKHE